MLIVSWLVRVLAILAAAFSVALYFKIEGELEKRNDNISSLNQRVQAAEKEKEEQVTVATRAVATESSLKSQVADLTDRLNQQNNLTRNYTSRIAELESSLRSLRTTNAEQNEQIAKLKTDMLQKGTEGLEDEYRKLYEETLKTVDTLRGNIVTLERERDEARAAAEDAGRQVAGLTTSVASSDSQTLQGEVLRVDAENNLVVINLGKRHNIVKDQQLISYKPEHGTTVTLRVDTVGPDYSIAQVISRTGARTTLPQAGDAVTNLF